MRYDNLQTLCALSVGLALSFAGLSTAIAGDSGEENQNNQETSEESSSHSENTSDESAGSAIVDPDKTGLRLGSGSVTTDEALAKVGTGEENKNDEPTKEAKTDNPSSEFRGSEPPCKPHPSCARANLGSKSGEFDIERIQKVAEAHEGQIRGCFDRSELADGGKIVVGFTVMGDGEATDVGLRDSTIGDEESRKCVVETVASWRFPKLSDHGLDSLSLTHPFVFDKRSD